MRPRRQLQLPVLAARQRRFVRLRALLGDRKRVLSALAGDHARLRRWLRRRRLGPHLHRSDPGLGLQGEAGLVVARPRAALVLAAALVGGLGEEVRLRLRQRAGGFGDDHVQRGHQRRGPLQREPHAQHQHAVQQQRQHHRRAEAFAFADARRSGRKGGGVHGRLAALVDVGWSSVADRRSAARRRQAISDPLPPTNRRPPASSHRLRSHRTASPRCSARTARPARGCRSGW